MNGDLINSGARLLFRTLFCLHVSNHCLPSDYIFKDTVQKKGTKNGPFKN